MPIHNANKKLRALNDDLVALELEIEFRLCKIKRVVARFRLF
jgi:hypothetical protein